MCSRPDSNVLTVWAFWQDCSDKRLTAIVNQSLSTGIFPSCMKAAIVKPLLKKTSLDSNVLKNFRPVSNRSFVSKLSHLDQNNLWHSFQSAYHPKTQYWDSSPLCFQWPDCFRLWLYLHSDSSGSEHCLRCYWSHPSDSPQKRFWYLWSLFFFGSYL